MIKRLLLALAAFLALPALAQTPVSAPAPKPPVQVLLHTSAGDIVIALEMEKAPISAGNFLHYVETKRLDGQEFYRAMHTAPDAGLIQGGVRDGRKLFPPIAHEATTRTGLHNVAGAISMANSGAGTARADFFILVDDVPGFDADGPGGDAVGFAAFGHVVEGMDVVKKIWDSPVSQTKGDGPMKGQMLDPTIKIIKASRVK